MAKIKRKPDLCDLKQFHHMFNLINFNYFIS